MRSQSSIYRGYDFYYFLPLPHGQRSFRLNPLSTEVMISTDIFPVPAAPQFSSQSSIYRGYDFYSNRLHRGKLTSNRSQSSIYRGYDFYPANKYAGEICQVSLNPLSTEVMISTLKIPNPNPKFQFVSILYLPRL